MRAAFALCVVSFCALLIAPMLCVFPLTLPLWFVGAFVSVGFVTLLGGCHLHDTRAR